MSVLSVLLSGAVGGVAVFNAVASGSLSMLGFGVDAVVDSAASIALIWRFLVETRQPTRTAQVEKSAEAVVGVALIVLSAYLAVASIRSLIDGDSPVTSQLALIVLTLSVAALPPIAFLKSRIARQLSSGALRADSVLTAVAAALAVISLLGFAAASGLGWWWADAVAALVVGAVILREGLNSLALSRRA